MALVTDADTDAARAARGGAAVARTLVPVSAPQGAFFVTSRTRCCDPSSGLRPGSVSGEPLSNSPGFTRTMSIPVARSRTFHDCPLCSIFRRILASVTSGSGRCDTTSCYCAVTRGAGREGDFGQGPF